MNAAAMQNKVMSSSPSYVHLCGCDISVHLLDYCLEEVPLNLVAFTVDRDRYALLSLW